MKMRLLLTALILSILYFAGCADENDQAPPPDEAHPEGWIFTHDEEAREDLTSCQACHGIDFRGQGEAVSCFACHFEIPVDEGQPLIEGFMIHPWGDNFAGHFTFAQQFSWTTCAVSACHGEQLQGGLTGPSCFAAGCHQDNPPVPHAVPYIEPALHGDDAEEDLVFCRNCHGRPPNDFDGGFVADPAIPSTTLFNNKILSDCSFCHPDAEAHPTDWQGENDLTPTSYLASHQDIDPSAIGRGCALCHSTVREEPSPVPAVPSCFAASFINAGNTQAFQCHPDGPF